MRILFLHQNFPAQFVHLVHALRHQERHDLRAVVPETNWRPRFIPTWTYRLGPRPPGPADPLADHYVQRVARGMAVMSVLREMKHQGFTPDLVIGHGGWGETLFVRDVWPTCRIILYAEYYYTAEGADVGFDPEFPVAELEMRRAQARLRNTCMSLALLDADTGIAPTQWQAGRFPPNLRKKISVIHEGIDTSLIRPDASAEMAFSRDGTKLRSGDEVVTFVSRNLEPYRGYHIFLRALPEILAQRPNAHAVIVGGEGVSYGPAAPAGRTWKDIYRAEVCDRLDMKRIHFLGRIPHSDFVRLMQVSAAHVYLTYPFVLSWSMLEAMSAGALVIASSTPPVTEMVTDGENGVLFDFFDVAGLAKAVTTALAHMESHRPIRQKARQFVQATLDLSSICLPRWLDLVNGHTPP